jgi:hypothetical protein
MVVESWKGEEDRHERGSSVISLLGSEMGMTLIVLDRGAIYDFA